VAVAAAPKYLRVVNFNFDQLDLNTVSGTDECEKTICNARQLIHFSRAFVLRLENVFGKCQNAGLPGSTTY
jgi:hypothetical protein